MGQMSELLIGLREHAAELAHFSTMMLIQLNRGEDYTKSLDEIRQATAAIEAALEPDTAEELLWDEGSHEWVCPNCRQNEFTQVVEGESALFIWSHNRHYMMEAAELGDWEVTGRKAIHCDNCDQIVLLPSNVEMIEHGEERHTAGDPSEPGHPDNPRSEY